MTDDFNIPKNKLFLITGKNFRMDDPSIHIVKKGIFIEDKDPKYEDVLLSLCYEVVYSNKTDIPGYLDDIWFDDWLGVGGCISCYKKLKDEYNIVYKGDDIN